MEYVVPGNIIIMRNGYIYIEKPQNKTFLQQFSQLVVYLYDTFFLFVSFVVSGTLQGWSSTGVDVVVFL